MRALDGEHRRHALHAAQRVDLAAVAVEVAQHVQSDRLADALRAVARGHFAFQVLVRRAIQELRAARPDGSPVLDEGVHVIDVDRLSIVVGHARPKALPGKAGARGPIVVPERLVTGDPRVDDQVFDSSGVPEAPRDRMAAVRWYEVELLVGAIRGIGQRPVGEIQIALDELDGAHASLALPAAAFRFVPTDYLSSAVSWRPARGHRRAADRRRRARPCSASSRQSAFRCRPSGRSGSAPPVRVCGRSAGSSRIPRVPARER